MAQQKSELDVMSPNQCNWMNDEQKICVYDKPINVTSKNSVK